MENNKKFLMLKLKQLVSIANSIERQKEFRNDKALQLLYFEVDDALNLITKELRLPDARNWRHW